MSSLSSLSLALSETPFRSYAYSYPHKTAYRELAAPRAMSEVWDEDDLSALFLYAHVPFCEMRCGFCNLFTMAKPQDSLAKAYMTAFRRQAESVAEALGEQARYARLAIGGGTPTQLDDASFSELFDIIEQVMGCDPRAIPVSCETSPETTSAEKVAIMRERGVKRVSIGVQSFLEQETRGVRRPQPPELLHAALDRLAGAGFETFNIDLIYGMPHQDAQSWAHSIERALDYAPQELYLYPLYVRPLTGLGNSTKSWDDHRLDLYRQGRDMLLERGFEQVSMRMFRRRDAEIQTPGPVYCCQSDGMVGLGAGARSYSQKMHYSTDYAVGRRGVVSIIEDYVERPAAQFATVEYGFEMNEAEHRRRHVILSLLSNEGLHAKDYRARFGRELTQDFGTELAALRELELTRGDEQTHLLTLRGFEYSDAIGPWLYSEAVRHRSEEFELR